MIPSLKRLILLDAEEIEFDEKKDGRKTGTKISTWKYTFLTPEKDEKGKPILLEAFNKSNVYKSEIVQMPKLDWDESKAKDYPFGIKFFNGEQKEMLLDKE